MKILVINPGSTSTKIGLFDNEETLFEKTLRHSTEELKKFANVSAQYAFRKEVILNALKEAEIDISQIDAASGMGGLLRPLRGGTYEVCDKMAQDLMGDVYGSHASNLGGIIALEIARSLGKRAFITDPVVVDELEDIARISGHPKFTRRSIFHALNQRATARRYCKENNLIYEENIFIVTHMGGGVSVGLHKYGRVSDCNNALDGCGPFSPERSGTLPVGDLVDLCFSGVYSQKEIRRMITGHGGLVAYFGKNDASVLYEEADEKIKLVLDALAYQIAKEIGAFAAAASGKIDAIILTGGLANAKKLTEDVCERVKFIAKTAVYPGENELLALAQGALRVLRNEEKALVY